MSFGISILDIAEISKFALGLYRSCKNAGAEFEAVSSDVNSLQVAIQKLHDELANPTSGFSGGTATEIAELNYVVQRCHVDLKEVNKQLTKFQSLKTKSPRTRDRIGFNSSKVQEIQKRLAANKDALNFQLIHVNTTTLHRLERSTQSNGGILDRIEAKLDIMIQAISEKRTQSNDDVHISAKELLDEDITEADLVENKKEILELLEKVQDDEQSYPREITKGEGYLNSKKYQATVEDYIEEEQNEAPLARSTQDMEQDQSTPKEPTNTSRSSTPNNDNREHHPQSFQGSQSPGKSDPDEPMAHGTNKLAPISPQRGGGRRIHLDFSRLPSGGSTAKKTRLREPDNGKSRDPEIQSASLDPCHRQQSFEEWLNDQLRTPWDGIAQRSQINQPYGKLDENELYESRQQITDDAFNSVQFFVSPSGITYDNSQTGDIYYPNSIYRPFPGNFWSAGMESWIVGRPSFPLNPRHPRHNLTVRSAQNDASESENCEIAENQNALPSPLQLDDDEASQPGSDTEPGSSPAHHPEESGQAESNTESDSDEEPTIYRRPLPCTIEELFHGAVKKLRIKSPAKYSDVLKSYEKQERIISVTVKRGLLPGAVVWYDPREKLCFVIQQKPHRHFRIEGADICYHVDVRETDFDAEWQHIVPYIDGTSLSITQKSGMWHEHKSQEGEEKKCEWQARYDGLGMFKLPDSTDRGGFRVTVRIL